LVPTLGKTTIGIFLAVVQFFNPTLLFSTAILTYSFCV